jgi:small subunit ribosomal protein S27Ae
MSEPKDKKVRTKRRPRATPKASTFYKVESSSITRLRKECPRCGKGFFLAEHKNRMTCGNCGYTDFRKSQTKKYPSKKDLMRLFARTGLGLFLNEL